MIDVVYEEQEVPVNQKLAIHGGPKVRSDYFGYVSPVGDEEMDAAIEVLRQRKLSGFYLDFRGGEKVQEFERRFAEYIGVKHAIAVNSGTSALHVALAAAGAGPGDEVIVPPFTFTATASSVLMVNAVPVFADIDPANFCMAPDSIRKAISDKTRVIMPVHVYGKVADMDAIMRIAAEKKLTVIEDACQSPGCVYNGKKVGSIGHLGVFSLVETKNIVAGEGGVVTTDDDELAQRCKLVRNHGEVWLKGKPRGYLSNMLGYNFRMTELHAAIAIEQLKKIDMLNAIRCTNASFLQEEFSKIDDLSTLKFAEGEVCHIFPLLWREDKTGIAKKAFIDAMIAEGVPVSAGYPHPLYKNPIFQEKIAYGDRGCPYTCPFYGKEIDYRSLVCAVAEDVCRRLVCVTQVHAPYSTKDMQDIMTAFRKVMDNRGVLK